jgi:hypothetical protein
MSAAAAVAGWLMSAPHGRAAEDCGTASMLASICGTQLTTAVLITRTRPLNDIHQVLLQSGTASAHERRSLLLAGTTPAAATTAIILPSRLPAQARARLGITADGQPAAPCAGTVPLSQALAWLGARREPLHSALTPGRVDPDGAGQAICSVARLWLGAPVALIVTRVYAGFLDTYPPLPAPRQSGPRSQTQTASAPADRKGTART